MENLNELKKMVAAGDERLARIETYLSKLEQKTNDRQSRLEKSIEEMQAMITDFMSESRRIRATETRSNGDDDEVEGVGLPVFDGVDPIGWIIRANHFFETHLTPEKYKVQCTLVCMESLAPRWVDWISQNRPDLSWVQLCGTLVERYDGRFKGNLIEQICSLKHTTGNIEEFIGEFIRIIIQLRGLPDSHCVGFFLHGLRGEVRTKLRIQHPEKLQEAIAMARDIEEDYLMQSETSMKISDSIETAPSTGDTHQEAPIVEEDEDSGYEVFKLRGRIKDEEVIVCISTGSNKSYISSSVADRLNLKRSNASRYKGSMMGFGELQSAQGVCRGVKLSLGSCSYKVDLFVFNLGLADVILGGDWVRRFGKVEMYHDNNSVWCMSFDWNGAHHILCSERRLTKGPEICSMLLLKEENGSYVMA